MKPAQRRAEIERKNKIKFRKIARKIPDNATLLNIMLQLTERPIREGFYRNIKPFLRFQPIPLEEISHGIR